MSKKLLRWLGINNTTVVKLYLGYGHQQHLLLYGHVLARSPLPQQYTGNNLLRNMLQLLRLFWVKPLPNAKVQLQWEDKLIEAVTENDGFFKLEWSSAASVPAGLHNITVTCLANDNQPIARGQGSIVVPHITQLVIISDVDDTFLISHSATIFKRLYTLFTLNARTRKAFEGVAQHYKWLQYAQTNANEPNPFFYVSSSEWNLYDYLQEFVQVQQLPPGVFLLNQIKQWQQLLKTGKTKHQGKFARIVRVMEAFPNQQFILLGDNSQHDPEIYHSIAAHFPGRIVAIYIRIVNNKKQATVQQLLQLQEKTGVSVCVFTHSATAIEHSKKLALKL